MTSNIILTTDDSGVTIQGPVGMGHQALLDRSNAGTSSFVFELNDADDITLSHLAITGGYHGIYASNTSYSYYLTVSDCEIYSHANDGVHLKNSNHYATFADNPIVR